MKNKLFIILIATICSSHAQVVLEANGPGDTYELINSVLALPNKNVVESPDCNHTDFGRHIDEVFDAELNKNIFRFHIHVNPDNDRCQKDDRQRNEIKTYGSSPENLKGTLGEIVIYKWKFRLSEDIQPSSSFTHIHQIKSVGGPYAGLPLYTLTLRKGNPDNLELRYAETTTQVTLKKTDLSPFKGTWVEVTEVIEYGIEKAYSIDIKRISDGQSLFSYNNSSISNWQEDADFARPKWGIYRSLNNQQDLKDEIVKFADFSIEETESLSSKSIKKKLK